MIKQHDFIIGQSYDRETVLSFIGSRQPIKRSGYIDGWNEDGVFEYCGQGSKGDQKLEGANAVLAAHIGSILIFETWKMKKSWKGRQRFLGNFRLMGYSTAVAKGDRAGDKFLIYSFVPETMPMVRKGYKASANKLSTSDIAALRSKALLNGNGSKKQHISIQIYRERSDSVVDYVLARAGGICEYCNKTGPFITHDGTEFLETHHIERLSDEGPDDIHNVAGICPNCHREAHYGIDIIGIRNRLRLIISEKEKLVQ